MSQFAREYPDDYEERLEYMLEGADLARKAERENALGAEEERSQERQSYDERVRARREELDPGGPRVSPARARMLDEYERDEERWRSE